MNESSFSGKVKEVVIYFPLHIIREQVLDPPSPPSLCHPHWSAEGLHLLPRSPLFLAMKDCRTGETPEPLAVKSRRWFTAEDFPKAY